MYPTPAFAREENGAFRSYDISTLGFSRDQVEGKWATGLGTSFYPFQALVLSHLQPQIGHFSYSGFLAVKLGWTYLSTSIVLWLKGMKMILRCQNILKLTKCCINISHDVRDLYRGKLMPNAFRMRKRPHEEEFPEKAGGTRCHYLRSVTWERARSAFSISVSQVPTWFECLQGQFESNIQPADRCCCCLCWEACISPIDDLICYFIESKFLLFPPF